MPEETATEPDKHEINISTTDLAEVRLILNTLISALNAGPKSRPRSLVVTKLEEAVLWAGEALRLE